MELYKAEYFGLSQSGDELFCNERLFTSKSKTLDWLREKTMLSMPADHRRGTLQGCDLYCHMTSYNEVEGCMVREESGIFSEYLADGTNHTYELSRPLFTSL